MLLRQVAVKLIFAMLYSIMLMDSQALPMKYTRYPANSMLIKIYSRKIEKSAL